MGQNSQGCQIHSVPKLSDTSFADIPSLSLKKRVKLVLKRQLSPTIKRRIKSFIGKSTNRLGFGRHGRNVLAVSDPDPLPDLQPGDWVRVRSRAEIETTLNQWGELRGCGFLSEMHDYCGKTLRVFRAVERFVDERDYRVKKVKGVVLLESSICSGTSYYGRCDRACYFFWRQEWLEKVERKDADA